MGEPNIAQAMTELGRGLHRLFAFLERWPKVQRMHRAYRAKRRHW